ncbi:MAG: thioredoxin family protein, partial [Planctomycetota bacterium]
LAGEYEGRVSFVKVNTDDNAALAKRFGVEGLPTTLIFRNGRKVETLVGYRDEAALRAALKEHAPAAAADAEEKKAGVHEITGTDDFKTRVREAKGPVLVKFHAKWCGWCRKLAPIVEKLAADYSGRMAFVGVDTDAHGALAKEFKVEGLPTMLVFRDGKVAERIVGYRDEAALKGIIEKHVGREK